ncbi:MAG: hypothetical protein NXI32_10570 [bacterium]|nr:hypothetical protein [bacterium]
MSSIPTSNQPQNELLVVPESLKQQLAEFRSRVWLSKLAEALAFALLAVICAFLTVYAVDRFWDTPREARVTIFLLALAAWFVVPYVLYRWVWKNRRFEQLARLLRVREPSVGDQLLSVLELAENASEQARSRTLCAAAIKQVAEAAKHRDLRQAAPPTHLRSLAWSLGIFGIIALGLLLVFPSAAQNAWARFAAPWRDTPRYTFTAVKPLPSAMVVPHGESVPMSIQLLDDSPWRPGNASLAINGLPPIQAELHEGGYTFELPAQVSNVPMKLKVGDFYQIVELQPKLRPELVAATARVQLPDYLQRSEPFEQDVRSGVLTAVEGSQATVIAQASRALESASINDRQVTVQEDSFASAPLSLDQAEQQLTMLWQDHDGLAGRAPFDLSVKPAVDELPSVVSQDFPRQAVVLDSEQINFQALAADDFGVKRIGMSWKSLDDRLSAPIEGEKIISAGGPERSAMQVPATFSAAALGIEAQPIEVRLWVEDYMPDRERVYSPPHVLFVLTAEQHAIWITDQLSKWHRSSLDVRDKEMQLHAANKRLRELTSEDLADEEMRDELRRQASLEAANGRRLSALATKGEELLRQAARNPEIGVGHLDRWAEMLQILNDIGNNRMPSVSDLLGTASQQKQLARSGGAAKPSAPQAGQNRGTPAGQAGGEQEKDENFVHAPQMPKITDMESSVQPQDGESEDEEQPSVKKKGDGTRLTLPTTTLAGPAAKSDPQSQPPEEEEDGPFEQALIEQEDLLAEFEKIADELNTILANLEGSTLVKRLKAASREQDQVAQKIGSRIEGVFGRASKLSEPDLEILNGLSDVEEESSKQISYIMDDMQSYFERRRMNQFKLVLDEMKESEVLVALQDLSEEIPKEQGMSIAQAEYWSDTLDRWAEDLVDPACSGQCPGSKTSDALPPSLILEVLKILESEVNLREETRVAEQARTAVDANQHQEESGRLSQVQDELRERTDEVVFAIEQLPDGAARFPKEIDLLSAVSGVMGDATQILVGGETGSPAIAAETEAIELLLQCKRINPKGGGGGGSSPGGGGKGDTQDSALALLGSGLNQNERREARDVGQATGEKGRVFPEEYQAGLDKYFEQIEQGL